MTKNPGAAVAALFVAGGLLLGYLRLYPEIRSRIGYLPGMGGAAAHTAATAADTASAAPLDLSYALAAAAVMGLMLATVTTYRLAQ